MRPSIRTVLGFLVAPLGPQFLIFWGAANHHFLIFQGASVGPAIIALIVVCYMLMLVCGIPMHIYLKRRRRNRGWDYTVAGGIAGAIFFGAIVVVAQLIGVIFGHGRVGLDTLFALCLLGALLMMPVSFFVLAHREARPEVKN